MIYHGELERVQSIMSIDLIMKALVEGTRAVLMSFDQSREKHMKHADGEMDGAKMAVFDDKDFPEEHIFNII